MSGRQKDHQHHQHRSTMAVSSLKGCWSKLSARIRDYIDVVDSYYRPQDEGIIEPRRIYAADVVTQEFSGPEHYERIQNHLNDTYNNPNHPLFYSHHDKNCVFRQKALLKHGTTTREHRRSREHHRHHHEREEHRPQREPGCLVSYERAIRRLSGRDAAPNGHASATTITTSSPRLTALGFQKRKTLAGQIYFVDMNGHKYWHDPTVPRDLLDAQLDLDSLFGPLPRDWEVSQTVSGKVYFINHIKKTTQFTDPRLIAYKDILMRDLRLLVPNYDSPLRSAANGQPSKKELYDKISILRQELLKQQVLAHPCRIDISRKRIFEDSFRVISQMQPRDLKKRLIVKFRGEEGLDYGGVAREWFYLLSREILNPIHGLFQYTGEDNYNLQINPDSGMVYREHLSYMNFCGRIIGMAIFHGHYIEGRFSLPIYKMLLRKPITLDDIEVVDPELHRSLNWILENDITDVIDTTFLVHHNAFGQLQEHELKPNGRNIAISEENKHEYVSLYVNYRCRRGIESQFSAIQRGFHELIYPNLVENFDEHELELLIGGLSKIDIEDWRLHTKLKNCTVDTPIVIWFWDIVKSYNEDKRARLLQFVTGSPRVPIQGFKALQGVNSELRSFTIHMIRNGSTDNLPKSHTCFNRIDLPPYETYDKLRDKLTQAIEETIGFTMQ